MRLVEKKVSDMRREQVFNLHPVLRTNMAYTRMIEHLMFGTFIDKDTKRLIISQDIVAQIEGKTLDTNYVAERFLEAFKRDVLPDFTWSGWMPKDGKSRVVVNNGFTPELEMIRMAELSYRANDYVSFRTGNKINRTMIARERKDAKMSALDNISKTETNDAVELLEYMNNLSSNKFSSIVARNIDHAYATVARLGLEDESLTRNISLLRVIEDYSQPLYQSSAQQRTVRIFPMNESMLLLNKDVRKALTRSWLDFDLRSAHLAIFGYMFDITVVNEFLRSDANIWDSLFDRYNLPFQDEVKAIFKKALYSIAYGMSVYGVKAYITTNLKAMGINGNGKLFVSHPVIKALLVARDKAMADIVANGGAYTIYGKYLSTTEYDVKSILSQMAQAIELKLLMPALRLAAANTSEFTITLWQHDGFSVDFRSNREYWIRRLQKVVSDEAISLGIHTYLEVDI